MVNKQNLCVFFFLTNCYISLFGQSIVTQIYSDFNGWWTSSISSMSTTYPNKSHTLLAVKVNNEIFSTGVNDALLISRGINFIPQRFEALPVSTIGNGGLIGIASGIPMSEVNNTPIVYLTDGIQGLDLGTAMFNWSGANTYNIYNIDVNAIGDGIPDILIPQIGDIPSIQDKFKFTTANGDLVGIERNVNFSSVNAIAQASWSFYNRTSPVTIATGFPSGTRLFRMIAYDFSDLGITSANYSQIANFVHTLSGSSDQPFIAYNTTSFVLLPLSFESFTVSKNNNKSSLKWTSKNINTTAYFSIERSNNGIDFQSIKTINANAYISNNEHNFAYEFIDENPLSGNNYYRIKQVDFSQEFAYSNIQVLSFLEREYGIFVYPNPSSDYINISGLNNAKSVSIINNNGQVLEEIILNNTFITTINISNYKQGFYYLRILSSDNTILTYKFTKS